MNQVEQDIELAHLLIEDKMKYHEYNSLFYKLWPFTTINMKEYLQPFNLENKTCITIQGSSDHIFELSLKNPKKIIGVDLNPLTKYNYDLKLGALSVLEKSEDFLKFFRWHDYPKFCRNNPDVFDQDIFQEMEKHMTNDGHIFWKDLFQHYSPIQIRRNLFNEYDEPNNDALYQSLNYLSNENYAKIRQNRENIPFSFIPQDVRILNDHITEPFDFLTLSNLNLYAHHMFKQEPVQNWKKLVEYLSKQLNSDGHIVAGYFYDIENENDYREIYHPKVRDKVFLGDDYDYHYFTKMNDLCCGKTSNHHDGILVYTKK